MAYIIAVNASILSQTGGPCECDLTNRADCDNIDSYRMCKEGEYISILLNGCILISIQRSDLISSPQPPPSPASPASSSAYAPTSPLLLRTYPAFHVQDCCRLTFLSAPAWA